ncbi:MAG: hypothetical protein AABY22_18960 [Nanoarchaeota archaeon]
MEGKIYRTCKKCNKNLLLTKKYFYSNILSKNGFQRNCKECYYRASKKYRQKNKDKIRESQKRWRKDNINKVLKEGRKYYKKNKKKLSARARIFHLSKKGRFQTYLRSAKKRNIFWNLSFEEFIEFWQKSCTYCNGKIETIGLDRIDNEMGYEKDNVISCCYICNIMKLNRSLEEFISQCKKIAQNYV